MASQAADNRIMTLFQILFRVLRRNYTQGNFIYISQVLSLILSEIYFREQGTARENRTGILRIWSTICTGTWTGRWI